MPSPGIRSDPPLAPYTLPRQLDVTDCQDWGRWAKEELSSPSGVEKQSRQLTFSVCLMRRGRLLLDRGLR